MKIRILLVLSVVILGLLCMSFMWPSNPREDGPEVFCVKSRMSNVYRQSAFPGTGSGSYVAGEIPWIDTGNICASGSASALIYPLGPGDTTGFLIGSNFGFNVPSTATIVGVHAKIYWYDSSFSGDHAVEDTVKLYYGMPIGDNRATGAEIPVPISLPCISGYGGSNDDWGVTALSPAMVNSSNFGFCFKAHHVDTGGSYDSIDIDAFELIVYYTN